MTLQMISSRKLIDCLISDNPCEANTAKYSAGEVQRRPPLCGCGVDWRERRGQRLPTDSVLSPAPRVSAGLRFAVILLSKTMDVGRDHLIHRKRSPFPYEGKDLMPDKVGETANVGRDTFNLRRAEHCRVAGRSKTCPNLSGVKSFPSRGRGTAPRWMR